ncbi:DUF1232 domain-containing protein [Cruoricaptor ignavus]|uniref:DUF1232 domain-containing protein n=2 Tax=Cruoricaptor ignavus TaxID=1118202 RepID=A0A7M1T6P4_9FLAO|nr:DUF1232 domain-containing protein [Cruoricaptor ignavus]
MRRRFRVYSHAARQKGFLASIPVIWRMLKQWRRGNYKTSQVSMWTVFLGLAYIISPIDILPEIAIPFVGIVDDLAVLAFLMPRLMNEVERFLQWESDKKNDITTIEVDAE